jgi:DNA-binding MurR/RpiR family transcriptional regulator
MKRTATPTLSRPPQEAHGHQSLSAYIQARFDDFSRSQKDVAQYIVDHLDEVAFQTAEELARRASTSSSTVVRFSQALGFEGFPELQASAREEYRRRHERPDGPAPAGGPAAARAAVLARPERVRDGDRGDHLNVEETARKTSRSEVEAAIDAVAGAEKVLIAGTDQMAFFASYLRHLLMLLDLRAEIVASPSQEALSRLGRIDETTLVIGLSAGRPAPARRPRDEARAPPQGQHRGDHGRHPLRGGQARAGAPVLLEQLAGVRALAHRAAEHDPGAGLRRLRPRHGAVRRPHQGLPPQVT